MKLPVVPFLTPPEDAVGHGGWLVEQASGDRPLPKEMTPWDYRTTIPLEAAVSVDRALVLDACALGDDSRLEIVVMARSNRTNAERVAARLEVPNVDRFDFAVEAHLEGLDLGGRLTLETLLVAARPVPLSRLAPSRPGSILWRSSSWTDLEGAGTQFPTDTMDFCKSAALDDHAGWQFRLDLSDPEARFMAAARLTLNSGHPAIARVLSGAKDEETLQILRTLNWDVTRQMVQAALADDHVRGLDVDPEAVSAGGVLRNLLARIWPLESPATLLRWQESDPWRLEVRLQQFGRLLP